MRRFPRHFGASILVVGLVVIALFASQSAAHDASTYYPAWWQSDLSVRWKFDAEFPKGDIRDRVRTGAQEWNDLPSVMHFVKESGDEDGYPYASCPSTYQKNAVHWGEIDGEGDTYARVKRCVVIANSEMWTFQMQFDRDERWYNQAATPPPSTRVDSQSLATHEFGHATGFSGPWENGHFDPNGPICTDSPKQTMCPFIDEGSAHWRSLEGHDVHTFLNVYP